MGYRIMIPDRVNKKILRFDKNTRKLLYDYISKNLKDTDNPRLHGKALTGNLKGLWRYRIMEISDSCIFYANLSLDGVLEKTEKYNDNNEIDEIEEINRHIRVVNANFGDYLPRIEFSNWL